MGIGSKIIRISASLIAPPLILAICLWMHGHDPDQPRDWLIALLALLGLVPIVPIPRRNILRFLLGAVYLPTMGMLLYVTAYVVICGHFGDCMPVPS